MTTALLMACNSIAQDDVVLNPTTIEGAVSVSGYTLERARMTAAGLYGSASQIIQPNNERGFYNLTVNVPADESATYIVDAQTVRLNDAQGKYFLDFFRQEVSVDETAPSVVDFEILNPSYISSTVTVTGSASTVLNVLNVVVTSTDSFVERATHRATPGANTYTARIPVAPGTYNCSGNTELSNGTSQAFGIFDTVTVATGDTANCDISIVALDPGTLEGTVSFPGSVPIDEFSIRTLGAEQASVLVAADGNNNAVYSIENLTPGDYSMNVVARANAGDDRLIFPDDLAGATPQPISVPSSAAATFNLTACQAYINGELLISGSVNNNHMSTATMESVTTGGTGGRAIDTVVGRDYDLIMTDGSWVTRPDRLRFVRVEDGQPEIDTSWTVRNTSDIENVLACAQVLQPPTYEIQTGVRTINFSVTTDDLLSQPRLTGSCFRSTEGGQRSYNIDISSAVVPVFDVPTGSVRVALPSGTCNLVASAIVDGSLTVFGRLTIPVPPDTDVEIDVGAPSLSVTGPEPGICIAASSVEVSGFVSDEESDIAFVTVNGINATLTPIENDVYAFSVLLPLSGGVNSIVVTAEDTEGNAITDTRTVRQDAAPPSVSWSPTDGTVVFQSTLVVSGTVSDDNDVTEVLLNGLPVTLSATGNAGEYSFSEAVVLVEGSNTLTLLARDSSGCEETYEIRNVVYQLQPEPTGVTRTIGYWKNHPEAIINVLDQYGSVSRCDEVAFADTCAIVGELKAKGNQNQANARRQSMAAALNCLAFGCDVDPQAACTHTLGEDMDAFNNSGDSLPFPEGFENVSADPKYCK